MLKTKKPKVLPDFASEAVLGFFASKLIIGVDEVGRGCIAGSVVAAAVVLRPEEVLQLGFTASGARPSVESDSFLLEVKDSKMIAEPVRGRLAKSIAGFVQAYSVQEASVEEIESLNILYASHLAMERAVLAVEKELGRKADAILVDGNLIPKNLKDRGHPLIKGDQKSVTIACASLLAKEYRDQLMRTLETTYPGYGLAKHKGYGTAAHLTALNALGVTPIHRRLFKGVKELLS